MIKQPLLCIQYCIRQSHLMIVEVIVNLYFYLKYKDRKVQG